MCRSLSKNFSKTTYLSKFLFKLTRIWLLGHGVLIPRSHGRLVYMAWGLCPQIVYFLRKSIACFSEFKIFYSCAHKFLLSPIFLTNSRQSLRKGNDINIGIRKYLRVMFFAETFFAECCSPIFCSPMFFAWISCIRENILVVWVDSMSKQCIQ